jgi:hypothetical protein
LVGIVPALAVPRVLTDRYEVADIEEAYRMPFCDPIRILRIVGRGGHVTLAPMTVQQFHFVLH